MTTATTDDNTYNPFKERNVKHPTTDFETLIHLIKAALGAGIMAMPIAFKHIGIWMGLPATAIVCFISTYCVHMLVKSSQTLCFRCRVPRLSYPDTAEQAFRNDPKGMVKMAIIMRHVVNFFLIASTMGCVCVYFVTAGRNLQQLALEHFPDIHISIRVWIAIIACPMLLLCLVRDLKYLVPFSMVANIFIFLSLLITFYFIFEKLPNPNERPAVAKFETWPAFFSICVFALENVGVVIPCENEMKNPEHFTGWISVVAISATVVGFLYAFLGFFGYLKYGELTEPNISLNLPFGTVWGESVKIMISLAVYFTILLQFYVTIQIVKSMQPKVPENWELFTDICIRLGVMSICVAISAIFPDLGPFIGLVGAITFSTLGFTLPGIISLVVFRNDPGYGFLKIRLIRDIFIIIFGLVIFILGTIQSLEEFKFENLSMRKMTFIF